MGLDRYYIAGVGGRMGRALVAQILKTPNAGLAGGGERDGSDVLGTDLGRLIGVDALGVKADTASAAGFEKADAVIDFSSPEASVRHADMAASAGAPIIIGTTGFDAEQEAAIAASAARTAIVKSGNMSLGVNLVAALARRAAALLPAALYDLEIVEAHHRQKRDAPSGTALLLGEAAAAGREVSLDEKAVYDRTDRRDPRPAGEIGIASVRGGGIIGDHTVIFAGDDEVIELSHRAIDRALFARGAVAAARWAIGRGPGLYSMDDVLGL